MARYIDAEILKNKILDDMAKAEREGKDLNGYTDSLFHLKTTPTAYVVPKSEVSIIGVQNMALENTNVDLKRRLVIAEAVASAAVGKASEMIAEAKREVSREIFEEIENLFAVENFRLICNRQAFADLKKKYTEDQQDG